MGNKIYNYNGTDITFLSDNGDVMVNATEMAKTFGKQPSDWTKTKSSQEFIDSLSAVRNILRTDLIRVVQGGNMQGTWMHEDVAMEFARWLSQIFAIWCNDRIKELLKYGMTATQPTLEAMVNNPDLVIGLAQKLKEERVEKEFLQQKNKLLEAEKNKVVEETKTSVVFRQAVEGSRSSCLIGELAKIITQNGYSIGQNRLFKWMRDNGYMGKRGENYNIPYQEYVEQGLFELRKGTRSGSGGVMYTTITPKVTGKGQIYFVNKFLKGV